MDVHHALVAGASGLVGRNLVTELLAQGWKVTGVARSSLPVTAGFTGCPVDLLDASACARAVAAIPPPTHLFYCARLGATDAETEADLNTRMLRNVLGPLRSCAQLRHVSLVHGTKWYGSHLGPYPTPAAEDDPRSPRPNWYFDQHDLVTEWQVGSGWTFSSVRPHAVCGIATDYPYNLVTLLGAYGAICAEAGEPLTFPGTEEAFRSVSQATDVGLLCRAMIWAATDPACANEAFNVINADYFRWCNLWPKLAAFFGVPDGGVRTRRLVDEVARTERLWAAMQVRHGLVVQPLSALANWAFADFMFKAGWDDMSATVKLRRYGFQEVVATEPMLLGYLSQLREARIIP